MQISNTPGRQSVLFFTLVFMTLILYLFWENLFFFWWILAFPILFLMIFYKKVFCNGHGVILYYPFRIVFRKIIIKNEDIRKVRFIAYGKSVNGYAHLSVFVKKIPFITEIRVSETDDVINFFKQTVAKANYKATSSVKHEKYIIEVLTEAGINFDGIRFRHFTSGLSD